ncbi:MAG: CapA family protein [Calditrichaeota bacterium]|nr:MAG: CapA family protein [Calditrichota bacterium]
MALLRILIILTLWNSLSAQDSTRLTLYFTGDVTLANHFAHYVKDDYAYASRHLSMLKQADIAMVNLENPLTRSTEKTEKKFNFKAAPRYVRVLTQAGIDIVTIANNHIYDYGQSGLLETLETLHAARIDYTGAGRHFDEAHHPVILRRKGIRLGFFSYYGLGRHSNSHPATADSAGTAMRLYEGIRRDIERFTPLTDVIIINFHWGIEKEHYPQPEQIRLAHRVLDAGADVIIGHHPHVLQGVELYKGKPVFYSLGNFIFGGNSRTYERSAMARVDLIKKSGGIEIHPSLVPVEIDHWQPRLLTGKPARAVMDSVAKYSEIFQSSIFNTTGDTCPSTMTILKR